MLLLMLTLVSLVDRIQTITLGPTPYEDASCQGSRWNCPCAGKTRVVKRDTHAIHEAIKHTKQQTNALLRSLASRFGNDRHVEDLRGCIQGRHGTCMETYLDPSCNMTSLPRCQGGICDLSGIPILESLRRRRSVSSPQTVRNYMENMLRVPLAYLAVYVEQARHDETRRGQDSVGNRIQELEDTGIYRILCHMHRDYALNNIPWEPTVPPKHTVLSQSCRKFTDRAPSDNRNFMVFYALDKLLHTIIGELGESIPERTTLSAIKRKLNWPKTIYGTKKVKSSLNQNLAG